MTICVGYIGASVMGQDRARVISQDIHDATLEVVTQAAAASGRFGIGRAAFGGLMLGGDPDRKSRAIQGGEV